jgi:hypothetical protein
MVVVASGHLLQQPHQWLQSLKDLSLKRQQSVPDAEPKALTFQQRANQNPFVQASKTASDLAKSVVILRKCMRSNSKAIYSNKLQAPDCPHAQLEFEGPDLQPAKEKQKARTKKQKK